MNSPASNPAAETEADIHVEGRRLVEQIHERKRQQTLKPGDKVRTRRDGKAWWTVQVAGSRYAIMTRQAPFKPKGDYLYSIIDAKEGVRGPCNFIGNGWDVSRHITPLAGWRDLHVQLLADRVEISHRQRVYLDIIETQTGATE